MEMEAIRSLVTSVPREGAASAAPGGLEGISLAKSGVPIDQLPLFPSPSWQEQEAAGLVRSFLPHCCQGTGAPRPAWLQVCSVQDGSSFGGGFVPLLLFSILLPKTWLQSAAIRRSPYSGLFPANFSKSWYCRRLRWQPRQKLDRKGEKWTGAISRAACLPGCQKAARGQKEHTKLRSWQPTAKQVAAELAEVPWRMGWREAAAPQKRGKRERKNEQEDEAGRLERQGRYGASLGSRRSSQRYFAFIFQPARKRMCFSRCLVHLCAGCMGLIAC